LIGRDIGSIAPLFRAQPYLGQVLIGEDWFPTDTDPVNQRRPPPTHKYDTLYDGYDHVFHCGFRGWPQRALPFETLDTFNGHKQDLIDPLLDSELDLGTPWVTVTGFTEYGRPDIAVGFSDDHFELKYGLSRLVLHGQRLGSARVIGSSSRWHTEALEAPKSWDQSAGILHASKVFLGCNSGLHVLACAIGKPVVMMEPSEARWNPIFFPLGTTGSQVTLVLGNDGKPTWDARHVADTLQRVLTSTPVRTDQERLS